ncbi:MAG: PAS domain S-box protein [Nitrospirota bacterium]
MSSRPDFGHTQSRLFIIFLVLALCIGIAGYVYYDSQKQQIKKNVRDELSAIADLKVEEITAWRKERIYDANSIANNTIIASGVQRLLQNPGSSDARRDVLQWLNALEKVPYYKDIVLVDRRGTVLLATSPTDTVIGSHAKTLIQEVLREKKPILSDFHQVPTHNIPHLDLVSPLIIRQGNKTVPIGAILMRLNPEEFLYPLIQSWPGSSKSAETLLIRKEGDSILFLNELRFRKGTALSLSIPLDNKRLPAAASLQGDRGLFEGLDYRDVPVLASTRAIPDTPWFLVAKIDIDEVYAPVRAQGRLMSLVTIMLISAMGLIISFWWRQKKAENDRLQYQTEIEHSLLTRQYDYLSKYANDIIMLVEPGGKILQANDRALQTYGYSRNELLRISIRDLRAVESVDEVNAQMQQVRDHDGFIFETEHRRKDGSTFPVEVSSRVIDVKGKSFFQSIIRDITDRRQAARILRESEQRYHDMLQGVQLLAVNLSLDGTILFCNDFLLTLTGWRRDEALGQDWFAFFLPEGVRDRIKEVFLKTVLTGEFSKYYENEIITRSGEHRTIAWSNTVLRGPEGNIIATTSIGEDITEKKITEIALIKEKNRSEAILAAIGEGLTICDMSFKIIYQNQVHKNRYGNHIGEVCYQAYQHRDSVCPTCLMVESFQDGNIHSAERTYESDSGTLYLQITSSPLRDETGKIVAGIELVRDISRRKRMELDLIKRNAFIEAVMINLPIGLAVNRITDGKTSYMNTAFEEIYGWPKDILVNVEEFFNHVYPDPAYRTEIKGRILSDIAGGDPSRMRWENIEITTMTGKKKLVTAFNIPLSEQDMMISTVQDVTARKLSEKRLSMLNECLLSFGPDPDVNINRLVALCGEQLDATCALYNRLEGNTLHALGQWNTPPDFEPRDKPDGHICFDVIKKGGANVCVIRDLPATPYAQTDPNVGRYGLQTYIGKAVSFGGIFVGSLCVVYQIDPMLAEDELKFLGIIASAIGVEESRKETLSALSDSEKRYKHLVESITDYIYTVIVENGHAISTYHGPGCAAVTGYTSAEFQEDPGLWYRMIFDGDRQAVIAKTAKILSGAPAVSFEHRIINKDGSIRWVRNSPVSRYDNDGRLIAYDGLITDITPLKLLENQLRQAQKMEAVGQLAGGIAHDFNNILTAIIGYSHLLLMKMEEGSQGRLFAEQIISSSERAAQLTRSLLAFSRTQILDLKQVDLNEIIVHAGYLLERVIGEDIEYKTMLSEEHLPVLADSVHIEQVLMNLAANARDAMPDGGLLLIETKEVTLGEDFIRTNSFGRPGKYACLSVTDTGIGMDENIRRRIFEPFFTTKEVGKGTGLGLSMVYGIVKQHQGYINVFSEPGKGSTFEIYLPLLSAAAVEKTAPANAEMTRGTETVLLAEDDQTVRNLARHVLEGSGYQVLETADGEAAVQEFFHNRELIDLLVFDIIMPKMNGKEAYLEIKKIRPDIKVLFMSGYTTESVSRKGLLEAGLDFVPKPISPSDLLKKIREILDRR